MSSFYDDASLVMIPSGYKNAKIYCEKPTDGSGDLTFTRASNATRVASDGLIEKVRTNLVLQSNNFGTTWTSSGVTLTTGQADPFGGTSATLVQFGGATTDAINQNISVTSGVPYTMSAWIKGVNLTDLRMTNASTLGTVTSQVVNGTWVRISFTATAASTGSLLFQIVRAGNASGQSFYIYGAQVETGDIATNYIATTSAAVSVGPVSGLPRLDYLNSSCPRLLLEGQRTNLVLFSEQINNAAWSKTNSSVTANAVTSPDGYLNADSLQISASTEPRIRQTTTQTGSTAFTFSCFAKKGNVDFLILRNIAVNNAAGSRAWFNLNTGVVGTVNAGLTASMVSYGNGWYRCVISGTTDASPTNLVDVSLSSADGSISGSAIGSNIYIYGAQLEAGSYATSYTPTLSTSVTRVADVASKTGISSLIGQTEGTLFAEVDIDYLSTGIILAIGDGTANNRFVIQFTNATTLFCTIRIAGVNVDYSVTVPAIPANGGIFKIALGYKTNDYVFALNGVIYSPSTATRAVPACSVLYVGQSTFSANQLEGGIKQTLLFKTRLTNAQLAELTTL